MANNLVIVESPAKASTIKGYLGQGYKVIASKGHVRDLPKSSLGVDIDKNFEPHYINIRGKGDLIKELKKEVKSANKVFLATDPDREGEAISWHLAKTLALDPASTKRVTFNEITKTAIKQAIKQPRQIDMNLVDSQQARRILDRIVGYQISPILWRNIRSGLSAGRVQSVATRIIVEREEEIKAFNPEEYWTVEALLSCNDKDFKAKYYGQNGKKIDLKTKADADKVLANANANKFICTSVKKALRSKSPLPPFITSTMQQEASKKLGFQLQRIMRVAQELYEGINLGPQNGGVQGLITYMRTDSLRISAEAQAQAKDFIINKYGSEFYPEKQRVYKTKGNAQDAHEAIRPSNINLEPDMIKDRLSLDQYKLYKLIWTRFTASQMESATYDTVNAVICAGDEEFHASGSTLKFAGYRKVYDDSEATDTNELPELKENTQTEAKNVKAEQHFTEPPARYTEATLIKFLEEMGIGRPSTYSPIITTIISRNYVKRDGKSLCPTPLGEVTTKLMKEQFADIVDYKFTASLEDKLDGIENGEATLNETLKEFYAPFEKELKAATEKLKSEKIEVPVEETDIICDKCGAKMVVKNGRFGKFAACPNYPECKNTMRITKDNKPLEVTPQVEVKKAGFKCEACGGEMVERSGRFGTFYACENYPKCKNTKQITKDTGVKCPDCGSNIVIKHGRHKSTFYSCEKYPTCQFSSWDLPLNEKCPDCGKILFRKKGKNLIVCNNKDCNYKRTEAETQNDK